MIKEKTKDPAKEEAMLETSMKQFTMHGFRGTKTDDIVKEAGVSKGLLFHYFGNKANLYVACYESASQFFYRKVDYSIWTDSDDLTAMVVNATKYKIKMQLEYPVEFDFLMRAFSEISQLPQELQQTMQEKLNNDIHMNLGVIDPIIEKLPLRAGLTAKEVIELINTFLDGEMRKVQVELSQHPDWQTMTDIEPLIDRIKRDLSILEYGFMGE